MTDAHPSSRWTLTARLALAAAALVAAALVLSFFWSARCSDTRTFAATLRHGRVHLRVGEAAPERFTVRRAEHTPGLDDLMLDWHVYRTWWFVRMPLWVPLLAFGAVAIGAQVLARRRRDQGRCRRCGYALAGLADDPATVCPECGTAKAAAVRGERDGSTTAPGE